MEDRLDIALDFKRLVSRRGIIHQSLEQLSTMVELDKPLISLDLQSNAFYELANHLYDWYIGKNESDSAINFHTPFVANPMLCVTFSPGREEEKWKRYYEDVEFSKELAEVLPEGCVGTPAMPVKDNPKEIFAHSFTRELSFYLGHILQKGYCVLIAERNDSRYAGLAREIINEKDILWPMFENRDRYVRAILEK